MDDGGDGISLKVQDQRRTSEPKARRETDWQTATSAGREPQLILSEKSAVGAARSKQRSETGSDSKSSSSEGEARIFNQIQVYLGPTECETVLQIICEQPMVSVLKLEAFSMTISTEKHV